MHAYQRLWIYLLVLCLSLNTQASQVKATTLIKDDGDICSICGVAARVLLNSAPGYTLVPQRHIYLFIEDANVFTEKNLRLLFERLSLAYPDPAFLEVIAFSSKSFLKQLIDVEESDIVVDYSDSAEGRKAAKNWDSRYPPTKGYFRAYYTRLKLNGEFFKYSPNPDSNTVTVVLRQSVR